MGSQGGDVGMAGKDWERDGVRSTERAGLGILWL